MRRDQTSLTAAAARIKFGVVISQPNRTSSSAQAIPYQVRYADATAQLPSPIDRLQQAAGDEEKRRATDQ